MNNIEPQCQAIGRKKRFQNILLATQVLILLSALNAYFLSAGYIEQSQAPYFAGIRFDIIILCLSAVIIIPILKLISTRNLQTATIWYFWLLSFLTALMAFIEGGLHSIPVMCFPIIAIFSALHVKQKMFLSICTFFCVVVIAMAINHHYGWFQGMMTSGTARMFDCLILILVSAYIAWVLGSANKRSMSDLKQEHQQVIESRKLIQHLADSDPLTGLANRTFAKQRFEAIQAELDYEKEEIGLFFIDLDNFKTINDLFDHELGDELLKIIANRLSRLIDSDGLVCRLGGDEFALFVKAKRPCIHEQLAKEILISLSEPHVILGTNAEITASIGITVINDRKISFDDARKQADMAMFKSKQSGKNDYCFYSKALHFDYMKNLTIVNSLKDALDQNLFDLHFQPKICISTGLVMGTEALLRWTRDNPDKLSPADFIPVIESTELIHDIGAWVVREACMACQQWHDQGHKISVAVNVSALQLARPGFYETVVAALGDSDLGAKYLEIELTEHIMLQENAILKSQLKAIKDLGVKLAIDDFGTGYSNMGYLTSMEVDTLKLDRSFISQIEQSENALVIVKALNEMAGVLGMSVVAEGVEKESERKVLEAIGCDIGQGFLWSKALSTNNLLAFLKPKLPSPAFT